MNNPIRNQIETYKNQNQLRERINKTKQINLDGDSMLPFLNPNEIITLFVLKTECLSVGAIIAFFSLSGKYGIVVHRIVKITKNGVITKGDNTIKFDNHVDSGLIIGKVVSILFKSKHITSINHSAIIAYISKTEGNLNRILPVKIMMRIHCIVLTIYKLILFTKKVKNHERVNKEH